MKTQTKYTEINGLKWVVIEDGKLQMTWKEAMTYVQERGMRLPTTEELQGLAECENKWIGESREFRQGENTLYLPAVGYKDSDGTLYDAGSDGLYWSSTESSSSNAYYLYFHSNYVYPRYNRRKTCQFSVLAIIENTTSGVAPDAKHTNGKLRYDLLPPEWLENLAKVMTYGADKYPANSWRNGDPANYRSAMMHHFEAYRKGETADPESNLPHLAHAMANLGILITLEIQKMK